MPFSNAVPVFKNPAGQLLEHPAGYVVIHYFHRQRQPQDLAALITAMGRRLLVRGWQCVLGDTRELPILSEAEKDWVRDCWNGRRVPRPPRLYTALLMPADVFARLSVGEIQHGVDVSNITYHSFDKPEQAHDWLAAHAAQR